MELDDLKRSWEEYDRKLDASIRLNTRLLHGSVLGKAETALKRLSRLLLVDLLLSLGAAVWLGSFLWEHAAEARFLVPAVTLHLFVIALVIACIRQIVSISQVDYGAPIVAIQKRLELLQVERIRTTKWTLLLAPLVWTPLFIVTLKGLFGVDVYAAFGAVWLAANVVFGLLVIAVGVWISRRYAGRMERSSLMQRLLRDIAGHNLTAATAFLRSLSQFEDEESRAGLTTRCT